MNSDQAQYLDALGITRYRQKPVQTQQAAQPSLRKARLLVVSQQAADELKGDPLFGKIIAAAKLSIDDVQIAQEPDSKVQAELVWFAGTKPVEVEVGKTVATGTLAELGANPEQKRTLWQALKGLG
ncbi:DNA polymerase III subunit psi [Paraferrimonas sedimenticola]|uniref:Uncharacterized protein n=1 Tax=Paraferrimonas sedimenticola TaxID=375674 RepID=A0AA37RZT1_9GAMM|nr:DNA polymerase III subunit psi [Paraferrimonas sedimenticola]GLP98024.1 hypothetical protein GCM10007895_33310 [Paraferrimonas sedimenticola]